MMDHDSEPELAGLGKRFVAFFLVDYMLAYIGGLILGLICGGIWEVFEEYVLGAKENDSGLAVAMLVWIGSGFGYFFVCNAKGRSIGKLAVGIRVIRNDGSRPGWGSGFARTIGYGISGNVLGLGWLWAVWDKKHQGWHDKIAGTIVVEVPRTKSATTRQSISDEIEHQVDRLHYIEPAIGKFCSGCGLHIELDTNFCPKCGTKRV